MTDELETKLLKEIEKKDKEIHIKVPSRCPRCKVNLSSYKSIKNHVKKFKHFGNYNKTSKNPSDFSYLLSEYESLTARLSQHRQTKKWIEELIDETKRGINDPKYNHGIIFAMECLKEKISGEGK